MAARRPVTPHHPSRDLRRELKGLEQQEPGAARAAELGTFTREAHRQRQLNLAMHTAQLCLDEDPAAPELLISAYAADGRGEEGLQALADLRDLARYLDRADVVRIADEQLEDRARQWVAAAEPGERRYRLRSVQSLTSRELADQLRDEL